VGVLPHPLSPEVPAMSSPKCPSCGLVNQLSDSFCRRCQSEINIRKHRAGVLGPREAARRSSPLLSLLALAVIGGAVYYVYNGMEKSVEQVQVNDAKRTANQAKQDSGLSRSQYDQQRAGQYGSAIQSSQGLNASQQHTNEINQLINRGTANK